MRLVKQILQWTRQVRPFSVGLLARILPPELWIGASGLLENKSWLNLKKDSEIMNSEWTFRKSAFGFLCRLKFLSFAHWFAPESYEKG